MGRLPLRHFCGRFFPPFSSLLFVVLLRILLHLPLSAYIASRTLSRSLTVETACPPAVCVPIQQGRRSAFSNTFETHTSASRETRDFQVKEPLQNWAHQAPTGQRISISIQRLSHAPEIFSFSTVGPQTQPPSPSLSVWPLPLVSVSRGLFDRSSSFPLPVKPFFPL